MQTSDFSSSQLVGRQRLKGTHFQHRLQGQRGMPRQKTQSAVANLQIRASASPKDFRLRIVTSRTKKVPFSLVVELRRKVKRRQVGKLGEKVVRVDHKLFQ